MFNIGGAELILILLIAFVVVGPKDLPKIARALGKFVRYIRAMIEEVKRETGIDDIANEFKTVSNDVKKTAQSVNPMSELEKTQQNINKEVREMQNDLSLKDKKEHQ